MTYDELILALLIADEAKIDSPMSIHYALGLYQNEDAEMRKALDDFVCDSLYPSNSTEYVIRVILNGNRTITSCHYNTPIDYGEIEL